MAVMAYILARGVTTTTTTTTIVEKNYFLKWSTTARPVWVGWPGWRRELDSGNRAYLEGHA
eukprot:1006299-Pleurochrysis_carterae.AAC.2